MRCCQDLNKVVVNKLINNIYSKINKTYAIIANNRFGSVALELGSGGALAFHQRKEAW